MAMKLLTKSELAAAKAAERKREVDEGLKLARKVDNLREIKAEEEASLAKFRKEAVAKINAELENLQREKESLTGEISRLKKDRKELIKPLDTEWAKIHKETAQLTKRRDELMSLEITITERQKGTKEALRKAGDQLAKAALKDSRAGELLLDADRANKEANDTLKNAREIEAKALTLKGEVEQELAERDMAMAAKERGLEMREANLKKDERELEREKVKLEDRKAMIERRIKKQK